MEVIQLAEVKLGSGYLSTRQEDVEAGTLEEYTTVLPFELLGNQSGAANCVGIVRGNATQVIMSRE
ncbi:hypothetical protein GW17_00015919, partial [Ensete ventricosum]